MRGKEDKFPPCRVRYPDSVIRQIFANGIRNPGNLAQETRRNPSNDWTRELEFHRKGIQIPAPGIRNPQPGIQNPRMSWIYVTLSEELTNVFVNAYTPYFGRSTPLSLLNITTKTWQPFAFGFTKHQRKCLKRYETLSTLH